MRIRDELGNWLPAEWLWARLPHWLRRRIGFLFPTLRVEVDPEDHWNPGP